MDRSWGVMVFDEAVKYSWEEFWGNDVRLDNQWQPTAFAVLKHIGV